MIPRIADAIRAASQAVDHALACPADGMTLREAAIFGSRLVLARRLLDGEVETEAVTLRVVGTSSAERGGLADHKT